MWDWNLTISGDSFLRLEELLCDKRNYKLGTFACPSSGLLIYSCYGVWHSTLELNAREQQAHASSYQRYDDHMDDTFSSDIYTQEQEERPYQGWSAPEERGNHQQQQNQGEDQEVEQQNRSEDDGEQYGYQSGAGGQNTSRGSRSKGRTNYGFDDDDDWIQEVSHFLSS